MFVIGAVIGGLVILQLAVSLYSSCTQIIERNRKSDLSLKLLEEQIRAESALRIEREQSQLSWNGYRKFVVEKKVEEAEHTCSFYLVPHDHRPLPLFDPGQFLTFKMQLPGQDKPVIRCYSLSCSPNKLYYRVTIKRVPPPRGQDVPPGLISNYFHDHVQEGDILDVRAPGGNFKIKPTLRRPLVLIAGGVGITPMLSMVGGIAESGSGREAWLFYGIRHRGEHVQRDYLQSLSQNHENIRVIACYSNPTEADRKGEDYQFGERISIDVLKRVLNSNNYDYYLCGPPPMIGSVIPQLIEWGVPESQIFTEAFGPASAKKPAAAKPPAEPTAEPPAAVHFTVKFSRSGKEVPWDKSCGSLLEFAEANGVSIDSGCRAGSCGTCEVAVRNGSFEHVGEVSAECGEGSCLTCLAVPTGNVEIDA